QFAQQGRAGAMWVFVFAFEAFDEAGQLRGDGAGLPPVLTRLGSQRLEAAMAVAPRPIQQRIDGNRRAFRVGDVVVAGGNLLSAAGEFAAGQSLDHKRGDHAITASFSALASMEKSPCPNDNRERRSSARQM